MCPARTTEYETMAPKGFERAVRNESDATAAPQALLERAACFYHGSLAENEDAFAFLRLASLSDQHLLATHCIGYCNGSLSRTLPSPENAPQVHRDLAALGILSPEGAETLTGCITLPMRDSEGGTLGIAGISTGDGEVRLIGRQPPHIWNLPSANTHAGLIAATTALDGLALAAAGIPNVIAFIGTPGPDEAKVLLDLGVTSLALVAPMDAAKACHEHLGRIPCRQLPLPDGELPAAFLKSRGPEALAAAIDSATPVPLASDGAGHVTRMADGLRCMFASRQYELRGIDRTSRRLRAAVRAERQSRLHVDTIDFYCARARRDLSLDLCRFFESAKEVIDADIDRMIRLCERWLEEQPEADTPPAIELTDHEVHEARAFGASDTLLEQIQADFEACGLVGESANKLLCYLAAVSRKMPEPISVLILSSSGAGKSALQAATIKLCPPEDVEAHEHERPGPFLQGTQEPQAQDPRA